MRKYLWMALLALAIPLTFTGCSDSDDDGDSSGGGSSKFVGTWALTQGGGGSG